MARPALYSTYALATELGRDPRMLSKALASTPPDGTGHKKAPAWKMTTALQAVAAYDANRVEVPVNINGNGARANGDAALDRICDEVEKAAAELEAVFDELASIKNLEQRRARAKQIGGAIGKYHDALEASASVLTPEMAELTAPYRRDLMTAAANQFLDICKWEIAPAR